MTLVPNPDPNAPNTFIPHYSPVYAQPVAASCLLHFTDVVPCALNGNLAFGYTATTVPATQPILWGEEQIAAFCFFYPGPPVCGIGSGDAPVLRVNFDVPTDHVTAIAGYWMLDGSALQAFEAFDNSGQSLAKCVGAIPGSIPAGCSTTVLSDPNNTAGWVQLTISRPTADISFVLIGGEGNIRPIAQVQFDSPVALQLHGLLKKVGDLRQLGRSLEHRVMFAETYYEVRDIEATCDQLTAFEHEVKAQSDRHIPDLTALQLLATATAIEDALSWREPEGHGPSRGTSAQLPRRASSFCASTAKRRAVF
jgi:hypothetical protein